MVRYQPNFVDNVRLTVCGPGSGPDRMVMLMEALVEFLEVRRRHASLSFKFGGAVRGMLICLMVGQAVEGNFQQGPPPAIDLRTPQRIVDDLPVRKILQVMMMEMRDNLTKSRRTRT